VVLFLRAFFCIHSVDVVVRNSRDGRFLRLAQFIDIPITNLVGEYVFSSITNNHLIVTVHSKTYSSNYTSSSAIDDAI